MKRAKTIPTTLARAPHALLLPLAVSMALRAEAAGPTFGAQAALNTNAAVDTGNDLQPRVATDGSVWVAAWRTTDSLGGTIGTDGDILFSRSTNALVWSAPQALNTNAATDTGSDSLPFLATNGAGVWIALWSSTDPLGGSGTDSDILFSRSLDGGVTWSAPGLLNTNATTDAGSDTAPRVTTDAAGNWVAVWSSSDTLGGTIGTDFDILVARSADNGVTWSAPQALNTNAATDAGLDSSPAIETDRLGNWVVAWYSDETFGGTFGPDFDLFVSRSGDNGATWSAPQPLNANAATDTGADFDPQVRTDRQGTWIAMWHSGNPVGGGAGTDNDIHFARSINLGATWTSPAVVSPRAATDLDSDDRVQLTYDGAGNWVAVWDKSDAAATNERDIVVSTSTTAGLTWTATTTLNSLAATDAVDDVTAQLATNGQGVWVAVWRSPIGTDTDIAFATGGHICGDSDEDPGELCDDGNTTSGDCCSATCLAELIGQPCTDTTPGDCNEAQCDGVGSCNPTQAPEAMGYVCRSDSGPCDIAAEMCDGASRQCPADMFEANGVPCADALVCNGSEVCANGACLAPSPFNCNDMNLCTADSCAEPGTCSNNRIASCCNNNAECSDLSICTIDVCSGPGGTCLFNAISGCCASNGDCNDSVVCTNDTCDTTSNRCVFTPIAACCNIDADCNDSNLCTTDTCAPGSGLCGNAPIAGCCNLDGDCADNDICTTDTCSGPGGACANTSIASCCEADGDCEDGQVCTTNTCNLTTNRCDTPVGVPGCCASDVDCADGNPCTSENCNLSSNTCVIAPVAGCCLEPSECGDNNDCTMDDCVGMVCTHLTIAGCGDAGSSDVGGGADGGAPAPDSAASLDAAAASDAGVADTGEVAEDDDGCGCSTATKESGRDPPSAWLALAAVLLFGLLRIGRPRRS